MKKNIRLDIPGLAKNNFGDPLIFHGKVVY